MKAIYALMALATFGSGCTSRTPEPMANLDIQPRDAESRMSQKGWEQVEQQQRVNRLANELQLSDAAKDQVAASDMAWAQIGAGEPEFEISSQPKGKDRTVSAQELDQALGKKR